MFVINLQGTLIHLEEDENSRFRYEIWFDYTRQAMNLIREGAMLAVPNFASKPNEEHLSILEVVSLLPMHYALGDDTRGYPGFVVAAAKSAVNDWEEQETESTEDTTKIRCVAIPTNFEMVQTISSGGREATENRPRLQEESNIPMIGAAVNLLDTELTKHVVNYGIGPEEDTIPVGGLIRDPRVQINVRVEDLLRTHFGIFAFTGAGKSNLITHLTSALLRPCGVCHGCANQQRCERRGPLKLVVFDLMGEYSTLLIKQLTEVPSACLVAIDEETLPGPVVDYLRIDPRAAAHAEKLPSAAAEMWKTGLFPRSLSPHRGLFGAAFGRLLKQRRVKIYRERLQTLGEFIDSAAQEVIKGNMGSAGPTVHSLVKSLKGDFRDKSFSDNDVDAVLARIDGLLGADTATTDKSSGKPRLAETARKNLEALKSKIGEQAAVARQVLPLPDHASITIPQLIRLLDDHEQSGLFVIQAHDPDKLRHFSNVLGTYLYEGRRRAGRIGPPVSFIFDEADEFIPQKADGTYGESSHVAMTLARRGRKFGLGIGIATQRVRYLNTSIMAQPHTYFVSKMPRASDRDAIAEAFGVSDEMFRQTFKFKKGDWLLMSYDATGLEAVPLPIHTPDSNTRIETFVRDIKE